MALRSHTRQPPAGAPTPRAGSPAWPLVLAACLCWLPTTPLFGDAEPADAEQPDPVASGPGTPRAQAPTPAESGPPAGERATEPQSAPPPPNVEPAPSPAALRPVGTPPAFRGPDVTLIAGEERTVHEYRHNGQLRMIKVVPKRGKPYYLVPRDPTRGWGDLEQADALQAEWVLWEF